MSNSMALAAIIFVVVLIALMLLEYYSGRRRERRIDECRTRGPMPEVKTGWRCCGLMLALIGAAAWAQDVPAKPSKPAYPTVTVPDFIATKREGVAWNAMRAYLKGVGDGLLAGNVELQHYKQPMHFCPPDGVQLNEYDYVEILDVMLKDSPNYNRPGNPVAVLLTIGLRRSFPCK